MMNHKTKHPAWVFDEDIKKKRFDYVSITHSKYTRGKKNIKLSNNPEISDNRDSYILPFPQNDSVKRFSQTKKRMFMSKDNRKLFYKIKAKKKK